MPGIQFYIDSLAGAPFDYHWEIKQRETETVTVPGQWNVCLVSDSGEIYSFQTVDRLDDETLSKATEMLATDFVSYNRAKALEDGPVVLVGHDDA